MLRTALHTGLALAALFAATGLALAQPNAQPGSGPHQSLRAKSILGASVSLQGGASAGTVHDIVLTEEGVVDYLIVSEGAKLVTVPWDAVKFNFEKRTAVINITSEKFREIPTFSFESYPNFLAPGYRVQIYRHYGLTPGQERRLDRRERREERREERRP
jgi:hypothetical protein